MAQTRSMAHVLQRILQFSLPSWLCQDRQERPITAAAAITPKIYWQDPSTGLQTIPLVAGAATDNFRIRVFHIPCDLLTSQGQNDLPSLEGMVAEFYAPQDASSLFTNNVKWRSNLWCTQDDPSLFTIDVKLRSNLIALPFSSSMWNREAICICQSLLWHTVCYLFSWWCTLL